MPPKGRDQPKEKKVAVDKVRKNTSTTGRSLLADPRSLLV